MSGVDTGGVRLFAVLKKEGKVVQKSWLVAFDGEVIMRLSGFDQIRGYLALRQEGIGTDGLPFNVDSIEQGNSHFDFVGLLDLAVIPYGQSADFF